MTEAIREKIPALIKRLGIETVFDAACGDLTWASKADFFGVDYTGADIVKKMVDKHSARFPDQTFLHLDITKDKLPEGKDLVIARDVLVHLSNAGVSAFLKNLKESGAKYLLATYFPSVPANADISPGQWRPMNLSKPPFNLPAPVEVIHEKSHLRKGRAAEKSMGLWVVADIT